MTHGHALEARARRALPIVLVSSLLAVAAHAQTPYKPLFPGIPAPQEGGPETLGPGLVQVTFCSLGEDEVWDPGDSDDPNGLLGNEVLGLQPTIIDFQYGWLYVGSGGAISDHHWIDVSDPLDPVFKYYDRSAQGNKPHVISFWRDTTSTGDETLFIHGGQGAELRIYDFLDGDQVGSIDTGVRPVAFGQQGPYDFRGTNGYVGDPNAFVVSNYKDYDDGVVEATLDLQLPFRIGGIHPIGNLMVVAGSQAMGVATFDISDPTNPQLLDSVITGNAIYTSQVYGDRLYTCESGWGVRIYDFSDPADIREMGFLNLRDYDPPTIFNPRYIAIKEGGTAASPEVKAFLVPGADKLFEFDPLIDSELPHEDFSEDLLESVDEYDLTGASDFAFPLGNMVITGGSSDHNDCAMVAVELAPDTNGPKVVYANPSVDFDSEVQPATCSALTTRIGLMMSDHIDVRSLDTDTFIVRPECDGGDGIDGIYSIAHFGMVNFTPDQPLRPNTTYEVLLPSGGVKDVAGNTIASTWSTTFTTGPGTVTFDPENHWTFDADASDSEGSNDGSLEGSATIVTGLVDGAVSMDGNDHVALGNTGTPDLELDGDGNDDFTISAWVYIDSAASNIQTILSSGDSGWSDDGFNFYVNTWQTSDGRLRLRGVRNAPTFDAYDAHSTTGAVPENEWHFVAATYDDGVVRLYVDGCDVTESSGDLPDDMLTSRESRAGLTTNDNFGLVGDLDELRIHDTALTQEELATLQGVGTHEHPVITNVSVTAGSDPSPNIVETGTTITVSVTATDPDDDTLEYQFDFGDGSATDPFGSGTSDTHSYSAAGRYTIILRVSDGSCVTTAQVTQIIHNELDDPGPTGTSTIVHVSDRSEVWNVNPDNDSVTCLEDDLQSAAVTVPVGDEPRFLARRPGTNELWVSCGSDAVWVVDMSSKTVSEVRELPQGSRPAGVMFYPGSSLIGYVALEGSGQIVALTDVLPPAYIPSGPVHPLLTVPRGLAMTGESKRLLFTDFISKTTTPLEDSVGKVYETTWDLVFQGRIFEFAFDETPDAENLGTGLPNYLTSVAVSPDGQRAWVAAKKDNITRGEYLSGDPLSQDNTVRSILCQLDLTQLPPAELEDERIDVDNQGFASAIAFSPVGDLVFATFPLNNEVLVFDAVTGNELSGIEVGLAPTGLAVSPDGTTLYVHNGNERTVMGIDVEDLVNGTSTAMTLDDTVTVVAPSADALSASELLGKQIFFNADDPRMSAEGYMSCASCHLDGDTDGMTWDFTDRFDGPDPPAGEGLRNTIDLRGRAGTEHGNVHWTANFDEIQDFEQDIRGAVIGAVRTGLGGLGFLATLNPPLGSANAGATAADHGMGLTATNLDPLADYVATFAQSTASPYRNEDGTLTASAKDGRDYFDSHGCADCHSGAQFTDEMLWTLLDTPDEDRDTPTLKGVWRTAPYLHDGRAEDLYEVFTGAPDVTVDPDHSGVPTGELDDLVEYLLQIDDRETDAAHWWPFSSDLDDEIGSNDGLGTSLVTGYPAGVFAEAVELDGSNDEIDLGVLDVDALSTSSSGPFTVSFWVYLDGDGPTNLQTVISNTDSGWSQDGWKLSINTWQTDDRVITFQTSDGTSDGKATSLDETFDFDEWAHVAVTFDGGTVAFWVNGEDVTDDSTTPSAFETNAQTWVGVMANGNFRLDGRLDQLRIHQRVLEPFEIRALAGE